MSNISTALLQAHTWVQGQAHHEDDTVTLTFDERQRSRYQTVSRAGVAVAWFLERGYVLQEGDVLLCQTGERFAVVAASETLSEVTSADPLRLTRVAYHLGNRHVPLAIEAGALRYQHDHVLDAMVQGLGLPVAVVQKPFAPESGAYATGHSHTHAHHHQHDH